MRSFVFHLQPFCSSIVVAQNMQQPIYLILKQMENHRQSIGFRRKSTGFGCSIPPKPVALLIMKYCKFYNEVTIQN